MQRAWGQRELDALEMLTKASVGRKRRRRQE